DGEIPRAGRRYHDVVAVEPGRHLREARLVALRQKPARVVRDHPQTIAVEAAAGDHGLVQGDAPARLDRVDVERGDDHPGLSTRPWTISPVAAPLARAAR